MVNTVSQTSYSFADKLPILKYSSLNNSPLPPEPFELRHYQKTCIAQVLQAWRIGQRALLLYAPTGSGKTAMAAHIINAATKKGHKIQVVSVSDVRLISASTQREHSDEPF